MWTPYHTVISVMPELYDDIWTAGKGMYKMEPVVADGGTVIIYAPHIDEVSYTHGKCWIASATMCATISWRTWSATPTCPAA
jgi:nickel-dependent lactate racemase